MPKLSSERQLVRDLLPPEGPSDFPEESPEIARTLEKELKAGLKTLQQRKLEQDQWDKVLSQRELALVERDMDLANLEAEHQALKASYEQLQQDSKLGDDVMRFLAREGKVLAETLGELMLVRRLGPNRLEHLNLLARELQELRGRVLGYPVASWRAPPQYARFQQRCLITARSHTTAEYHTWCSFCVTSDDSVQVYTACPVCRRQPHQSSVAAAFSSRCSKWYPWHPISTRAV